MRSVYLLLKAIIVSGLILVNYSTVSQTWRCYTNEINSYFESKYPQVRQDREKLTSFIKKYNQENPVSKDDQVYIIPVVFHIVHDYGPENISYEQILDAMDILNRDFRLQNPDTVDIVDEFKNIAADTRIEFRLARIDPDGNCTMGVTRTVSEQTYDGSALQGINEVAPAWPRENYLNIWVCNTIPGGIAGYAFYPSSVNSQSQSFRDGVVITHSYLGSIGTSNELKSRILTHEIAHAFDLAHTWGRAPFATPGAASNCNIDDEIEDTPNTIGNLSCNLSAVSCESLDNVQNYMEYSYCSNMFTQGQAAWMRAALNSDIAQRNNLWQEENLIATGVNEDYVEELCVPIVDFFAEERIGCEGLTVNYYGQIYNTIEIDSYSWDFEGGAPALATGINPIITYNSEGKFDVSLFAENAAGSDSKIEYEYIRIYNPDKGLTMPYTEDFDLPFFPDIDEAESNDFYMISSGLGVWEHTDEGARTGTHSLRIRNRYNDNGTKNIIMFPLLNLESQNHPIEVSFWTAYGRTSTTTADRLRVFISNDCGETKRLVNIISATQLTSTYVESHANYYPDEDHWKKQSFTINASNLESNTFRLILESEANGGNALYIDDVSISQSTNVDLHYQNNSVYAYPNPFNQYLQIDLDNNTNEQTIIEFYDVYGRLLIRKITKDEVLNIQGDIIKKIPKGLILINIISANSNQTLKIIKE